MWRLKVAEGSGPWLRSTNNHVGREVWEFDPSGGTPEEIAEVERARETFRDHWVEHTNSADLIMRLQVLIYQKVWSRKQETKKKDTRTLQVVEEKKNILNSRRSLGSPTNFSSFEQQQIQPELLIIHVTFSFSFSL